jgi:hypothetical protein
MQIHSFRLDPYPPKASALAGRSVHDSDVIHIRPVGCTSLIGSATI